LGGSGDLEMGITKVRWLVSEVDSTRYEGRPMLRPFEGWVMLNAGELPEEERRYLEGLEPELRSKYGEPGAWHEIVAKVLVISGQTARDVSGIRQLKKNSAMTGREFARDYVESWFERWRYSKFLWGYGKWTQKELFGKPLKPVPWDEVRDQETILEWLEDDDPDAWGHAARCIHWAYEEEVAEGFDRERLLAFLWRRFEAGTKDWTLSFSKAILTLAPGDAGKLLRAEYLREEQWTDVLTALMDGGDIPAGLMPKMMEKFKAMDDRVKRWHKVYEKALVVMARSDSEAVKPLIEAALKSGNHSWVRGAEVAQTVLAGVDYAFRRVWEMKRKVGYGGLTEPQRNLLLCDYFSRQVYNGGIAQVFDNDDNKEYRPDIPSALHAVGAELCCGVMEEAIRLKSAVERGEMTDEEFDKAESVLTDKVYDAGCEGIDSKMMRYAIEHAGHFRRGAGAS